MRWAWASLVVLLACVPRRGGGDATDVLVIAPHPDDEVLLAGGVLARAVKQGQRIAVILVTNGDYGCERDGYLREAESIAALRALGVKDTDVHFLGYPDGALAKLSPTPLPPMEHRDASGQCIARTGTYADRAAGRLDEHTRRTGAPADWTSTALQGDLTALLTRLAPRQVYLPHGLDDHPDHAMTYVFFRRALDGLAQAPTLIHRGVVHAGPCWPSDCKTWFTPELPLPPLPPPLAGYLPDERVPTDAARKLEVIAHYTSQAGTQPKLDWLASFARPEEVFFTERLERVDRRWVQRGSTPRGADERVLRVGAFEEVNRWGPEGFAAATVRAVSQ